jgi:mono/diheme cytochrome c family protein
MPGFKLNPEVTDAQLTDIATFVRFAWGNGKEAVKPKTLTEMRAALADRETAFSPEEVEKLYH